MLITVTLLSACSIRVHPINRFSSLSTSPLFLLAIRAPCAVLTPLTEDQPVKPRDGSRRRTPRGSDALSAMRSRSSRARRRRIGGSSLYLFLLRQQKPPAIRSPHPEDYIQWFWPIVEQIHHPQARWQLQWRWRWSRGGTVAAVSLWAADSPWQDRHLARDFRWYNPSRLPTRRMVRRSVARASGSGDAHLVAVEINGPQADNRRVLKHGKSMKPLKGWISAGDEAVAARDRSALRATTAARSRQSVLTVTEHALV